ncbi:unnamed protein product, partial [Prorocentrum cordatum]
ARLQLVWRTMMQNGVDSSGMPTDPKTFTFEQAAGSALPKPWAASGSLAREASMGREGSVARAIRPIKACQKKAREKANSLLGLPMTKLSDSNLDASGLAENKSDGKGCHCRWLRGLSELSKAGRRTWKTNKWYLLRGFLLLVLGLVVIVLRLDMDRPSTLPRLMAQEPDADLLGRAGAGT